MAKYRCPKCGMTYDKPGKCTMDGTKLVKMGDDESPFSTHHKDQPQMTLWETFKASMTMTMGMEHTGLAGREMARLMEEDIKRKFLFSLTFTIPIILYSPMGKMIFGIDLPSGIPVSWLLLILTTPVFFYCGWIFLYSSYKTLLERKLNMAVLIAVGITAAYTFSIALTFTGNNDSFYEAAAMLITFVLFGHWIEMKSRRGTTDALQALFDLVPPQARVIRNGKEMLIPTSEVKIGEIISLKPGDKVPVDGEVTSGETSIDESLVTGESIPALKTAGMKVVGGSVNTSGYVKFKTTRIGRDTVLGQIVKMVETAQNSKAPGQKLADKFAGYLVIVAVGGGALTFSIWYLIMGNTLMSALTFAISTVVIACPDALGLATPTAVAVGTGLGAKHNILIKDAMTLEQLSKINAVVLDKTGTLTEGKPKVTDVIVVKGYTADKVVSYLAAAESKSSHPLSNAISEEAKKRHLKIEKSSSFKNIAGLGVSATIKRHKILIGTMKLMKNNKINIASIGERLDRLLESGKTIMIISIDKKVAGVVAVSDVIKPNAKIAIQRMQELGLEVAMISGDNKRTAESVARRLGITRVFAEVLPEDKAAYVKRLQKEGKFVAMVGDGVNDAPALAQSDIGIAIGAGTDVAIETSNVVLMKSDPADILRAIRLSKATVVKMKQNLFWASIYNVIAIPVAAGALYPAYGILLRPEVAALLMSMSSVIVATNAVLLKRAEKDLITV